jgi:hypothetical protein
MGMSPGTRYQAALLAGALLLTAAPAFGQQAPVPDTVPRADLVGSTVLDGTVLGARRGLDAARYESTAGWVWGGVLGGLTLGPVGAGLAWTLANNSDVSLGVDRRMLLLSYDGGFTYVDAYERAYADALLARRKRSALTGGAIGTAALVATATAIWAVYYYY